MKHNDISSLRHAIATLAPTKNRRRYSPSLRARIVALVRAHPERGIVSLAGELDMAPQTLERIVGGARAPLLPVTLIEERSTTAPTFIRGPRGIVVEGLDVNGIAELIRALS
jgi:transposase-like protein